MKELPNVLCADASPAAKVVALYCAANLAPDEDHVVKPSHMSATLKMSRVDYERGHREAVKAGWIRGENPDRVRVPMTSEARRAVGLPVVFSSDRPLPQRVTKGPQK